MIINNKSNWDDDDDLNFGMFLVRCCASAGILVGVMWFLICLKVGFV